MYKNFTYLSFIIVAAILLGNRTGPSAVLGHTGSPGDNQASCVNCHGSIAKNQTNMISTNMTGGQYIPGDTFDISITAEDAGKSVFGFEITCENPNTKQKVGTWLKNNETRLKRNGGNIGHNGQGASTSDKKTWTVQWVAPSQGVGPLTFYAVTMCTNGDGVPTNDNHYSSTYSVVEGNADIAQLSQGTVSVFPNPTENEVYVNVQRARLKLFNLEGKLLINGKSNHLFLNQISPGIYLLQVDVDGQKFYQKIQKL